MPDAQPDPRNQVKLKKRRASRRPYCKPCKERRVKCSMERPVCVRCQRKTRNHECIYEDDIQSPASTAQVQDIVVARRKVPRTSPAAVSDVSDNTIASRQSEAKFEPDFDDAMTVSTDILSKVIEWTAGRQELLNVRPLRRTEFEEFFGIEKAYRTQTLSIRLKTNPDEVYRCVFVHQWLFYSPLLAFPRVWLQNLPDVETALPVLNFAIKAIGALKLDHRIEAAAEYTKCIQQLIPRLSPDQAETVTSFEICTTILMLVCYELMKGADLSTFEDHLEGVSIIMRRQVAYLRSGGDGTRLRSALAVLMYKSYRNIETCQAALQQTEPRLTVEEWNTLLPTEFCEDEQDFERHVVFEYMNRCSNLTAMGIFIDIPAIEALRNDLILTLKDLPYTRMLVECPHPPDSLSMFDLGGKTTCYDTNLYVPGKNLAESIHRSVVTVLLLAVKLHLELYLTHSTTQDLARAAEILVRLVQHVVITSEDKSTRGRSLPWVVYSLVTAGRAMDKCGGFEVEKDWLKTLLHATYRVLIS